MKKTLYETNLWQTSEHIGFLKGFGFIEFVKVYLDRLDDTLDNPQVIVEKTKNPFYVKEIITGMKMPVIHINEEIRNGNYQYRSLPNVHTAVRKWTGYSSFRNNSRDGLRKVNDKYRVEDYMKRHSNEEEWRNTLEEFFAVGYSKASIHKWDMAQIDEEYKQKAKEEKSLKKIRRKEINKKR